MDLAERIRWALQKRGGSARAWSLAAGRSHAQVTMMLRRLDAGETPAFEADVFEDLARAAGVNAAWLQSGRGTPDEEAAEGSASSPYEGAVAWFLTNERHEGRGEEAAAFIASRRGTNYAGAEDRSPEWWLATLREEFRGWRKRSVSREIPEDDGQKVPKLNARRRQG